MEVDFAKIEKKWQDKWEKTKCFKADENSRKKKYYVLEMYPYPSASFLHVGHVRNYAIGDVYARFKRMSGFNVLYPMGYDSFGLPAETAAKKVGIHPRKYTEDSIKKIMQYQKALGNSYDWSRVLASHEPDYYKWNQYFFLKLFEKGLAYRKKAPVNWCKKCESVLANEEAEGGKCWRCGEEVVKKEMEQWFFRITAYADKLLDDLDSIDWPEQIKTMQRNWIGRSEGVEINFEINNKKWPVFTTRPDTIYGVTFLVISAKHPKLMELVSDKQKKDIEKFLKKIDSTAEEDLNKLDKEGVFTGSYAINPMTKEKVPVYAGNFVVADYASGMIMAVPAHDQRDFEFADKYEIPVKIVIQPEEHLAPERMLEAYAGEGRLVNSGEFDGLFSDEAKEHITKFLEMKKLGKRVVNYKIRDWMISRQRYWGTPIPIIYCDKCGVVPVKEKELPVLLPEKVDFKSVGNPIASNKTFLNVKCPKCGGKGKRETDTMGGFVDSSWYFLRYCDSKNKSKPFDTKKVDYWMPVDQYIGGAEHAVMHLMYARFFVKALKDLGLVKFNEPFKKLFNQGIVYKDGGKMSKSAGNVVYQTDISNKYGIDTARLFLMSVSSPDKQMEWNDEGVEGSYKFIRKLFDYFENVKIKKESDDKTENKLNKTIKQVSSQIENFEYNLAVISIRTLFDSLPKETSKSVLEKSLKLLHPFCPHTTEELWEKLGNKNFISLEKWPEVDEKKINDKFDQQEKTVEDLINDINNILKIVGAKKKIFIYSLPHEKEIYKGAIETIKKKTNLEVSVYAVNDKDKYDPENKSKKSKPNKPAVYLE
ncbi:Leucine--tRNA ligase [uncultured archaeon]|nr:Leucine--tRNA ligase [uncultured archaeon]